MDLLILNIVANLSKMEECAWNVCKKLPNNLESSMYHAVEQQYATFGRDFNKDLKRHYILVNTVYIAITHKQT